MDLWSAIFTVIRRWYVALPILLVSIVAMVVIGGKMKPDYKAEASVVFTAPARKVVNGQEQPFKNQYANDTKTLAAAVYRQITNADQHRTLDEDGFSPRYELVLDQFSAIMDIEVTATSQEQAIDTANQLISETDRNALAIQRQSRPPEDELVRVDKIYLPVDAELVPGSKSRVMATVLLLGLVAAASAVFMVESLATRRRGLATDAGGAVRYPDGVVRHPDAGPAAAPADGLAGRRPGRRAPYAAAPGASSTTPAHNEPARLVPIEAAQTAGGGIRVDADELDALLAEVPMEPQAKVANGSTSNQPRTINRGRTGRGDGSDTNGRSTKSVRGRTAAPSSTAGEEHDKRPADAGQDDDATDRLRGDHVPQRPRPHAERLGPPAARTSAAPTARTRRNGRPAAIRGDVQRRIPKREGRRRSRQGRRRREGGQRDPPRQQGNRQRGGQRQATSDTRRDSKATANEASRDKTASAKRPARPAETARRPPTRPAATRPPAPRRPARPAETARRPSARPPATRQPATPAETAEATANEATDPATTAETADTTERTRTTGTEVASNEEGATPDPAGSDEHGAEADQPAEPAAAVASRSGSSGAATSSDAPARTVRATTTAHNAAGSKSRRARRSLWSSAADSDRVRRDRQPSRGQPRRRWRLTSAHRGAPQAHLRRTPAPALGPASPSPAATAACSAPWSNRSIPGRGRAAWERWAWR